jgi:hypothetical protein
MRIVIWNCNMVLHDKYEHLLALAPDIAVVPQCANINVMHEKHRNFCHPPRGTGLECISASRPADNWEICTNPPAGDAPPRWQPEDPHTALLHDQGRVEMWRGGFRLHISVSASFVWRCLSGVAVTPFPHPAHR